MIPIFLKATTIVACDSSKTLSKIIGLFFATTCKCSQRWIRFYATSIVEILRLNIIINTVIFYILWLAIYQNNIGTNGYRNYKVWNKLRYFRIREFSQSDARVPYGQMEEITHFLKQCQTLRYLYFNSILEVIFISSFILRVSP